jgi:broad specificity phosphatase PhoE
LLTSELKSHCTFQEIKTKPLNAIYSTDYKRTQNTAIPTAEKRGKEIKLYNRLKYRSGNYPKENKGKQALVVGHPIHSFRND